MQQRRALLGVLLALTGLCGAAAPAAQAASSPDYIGVNLQPLMKDPSIPEGRWGSYLQPLQDGAMTVSRIDINWTLAEPAAPTAAGVHTYTWNVGGTARTSIDFLMASALSHGIRPVPTFTAPPAWARGPGTTLREDQFGNFGDFIAAFAKRYGPGGSFWTEHPELPNLPVQSYEIWNEANSTNSWVGHPDAAAYARMLQVVYPKVKAAQPGGLVLASIGWQDAGGFLSGVIGNGGANAFDAVGFHPYTPHAIETINLINRLRAYLASVGRINTPILVTETGQPATYTGPGAAHAYDGMVSDAARAASLTFAADAIGRSDCGVNEWLVYAVTGSETNREIIGEGFMGILHYADGTPNVTGKALQAAQQRWVYFLANNGFSGGHLALCSTAPTPDSALLPLDLSVTPSGRSCVTGTVGYDGNPLEAATLTLTRPDNGAGQALQVDAFGHSTVCIPNGPAISTVDVQATVPKAARSATYRCSVPIANCQIVTPPPVSVGKACSWTVHATTQSPRRIKGSSRLSTKTKARLVCDGRRPGFRISFIVGVKPKGRKHEKRVRTVMLQNMKTVTFTAKAKVKKGDRLVLLQRPNAKTGVPKIKTLVTLKAPKR